VELGREEVGEEDEGVKGKKEDCGVGGGEMERKN